MYRNLLVCRPHLHQFNKKKLTVPKLCHNHPLCDFGIYWYSKLCSLCHLSVHWQWKESTSIAISELRSEKNTKRTSYANIDVIMIMIPLERTMVMIRENFSPLSWSITDCHKHQSAVSKKSCMFHLLVVFLSLLIKCRSSSLRPLLEMKLEIESLGNKIYSRCCLISMATQLLQGIE